MRTLLRVLVTFVSGVATLYFVYWMGGALIALIFSDHVSWWIPFLASILAAIVVSRYVWIHTDSLHAGFARSVLLGALVTGGIAFSAGFFGPILFAPGANQGPLLGIFITGPLGFILGAVGGAIYWFARGRRTDRSVNDRAA
jgi:hypothetical protein